MFNFEFIRYLISGLINSVIGYLAFIISLNYFSVSVYFSNLLSYALGLISAYFLNKYFVFEIAEGGRYIIFVGSFLFSYCLNLLFLIFFIKILNIQVEIAQLFAMAVYTLSFYILNKFAVFSLKQNQ
jgi:putative flippase GtrA